MPWPLASHFSTMLQTPQFAFKDPILKKATILRNAQGQPKPWAGAFAVVYQATLENGEKRALRVFSSESAERRERYEQISLYFREHPLKALVNFEYRESAVRSTDGRWYPLVIMDWVEGHTLFQWVENQCQEGNSRALRLAADVWAKTVREIEEAGIAHGDYQQANILVTANGQMKLVDYDCMCVPSLMGRRNLEIGVEPYQHPERDGQTLLSPTLDRFSAIMIYLALRGLATDVSLWQKYVLSQSYDKLLFRKEDIQSPDDSSLIRDLRHSSDQDVREITEILIRSAHRSLAEVPSLESVVSPIRRVVPLIKAQRWQEAVAVIQELQITEIPSEMKELVERAYEESWKERALKDFQNLPQEVNEKSDRMFARVCNDKFLEQFPVPPNTKSRVFEARSRVQLLDRLAQLVNHSRQNLVLAGERTIAAIGAQFPSDYAYVNRPRVIQAQKIVKCVDALIQRMEEPEPNEILIAEAWANVKKNRFQELLKDEQRIRADLAAMRAPRVKVLESFTKSTPLDLLDRQILSLWDEKLFEDCPQVQKYEKLYDIALRRRVKLETLSEALEANDISGVESLLADPLLAHYPFSGELGARIRAKKDQWTHSQGMIGAMNAGDGVEFLKLFNVNAILRDPEVYAPIFPQMEAWIRSFVLPLNAIGLRPVLGRASLLHEENGSISARWNWMHPRFGSSCVLGVYGGNLLETDRPEDIQLAFAREITRSEWEKMGSFFSFRPQADWNGMAVIVWGVVDTGFVRLFTPPLVLGTLEIKKKSWFSWK
ncbi:MAG: hypothetical protein IJF17_09515 [Thermoguttaceae bacterium]|nr:hypothetical protein [Thermoguttaceae bacterium]